MYVCICRGITDKHVTQAVCQGARCVKDVNKQIGKPVQCGRCCLYMKEVLQEAVACLMPKTLANEA